MNTAVIVCSSDFNEKAFRALDDKGMFDYVMAVDGGYQYLLDMDRRADIVLGDFDSLGWEPKGIHSCKFPVDKDDSDLQLTITRLLSYSYDRVFIFGALGRRLDHTLSNIRIGGSAARRGLQVIFVGMDETVFMLKGGKAWEADVMEDFSSVTGEDGLSSDSVENAGDNSEASSETEIVGTFKTGIAELDDDPDFIVAKHGFAVDAMIASLSKTSETVASSDVNADDVEGDNSDYAEKTGEQVSDAPDAEFSAGNKTALEITKDGYFVAPGTTISLMQVEPTVEGLFIRGLKWESDDAKISEHPSLGLSNVSTEEPILICLDGGTAAVIVNSAIC